MREGNVVVEKSYAFALQLVRLALYLRMEQREFVLSKQVLRSGTSIGANVEEAIGAQSKREFLSKMRIACREARETHYWIRLLRDSGLLKVEIASSVLSDCEELLRLTASITRTLARQLQSG